MAWARDAADGRHGGGGRRLLAAVLASVALLVATAALGTWWASLLLTRASGVSLSSAASSVLNAAGVHGDAQQLLSSAQRAVGSATGGGSGSARLALSRAEQVLGSVAGALHHPTAGQAAAEGSASQALDRAAAEIGSAGGPGADGQAADRIAGALHQLAGDIGTVGAGHGGATGPLGLGSLLGGSTGADHRRLARLATTLHGAAGALVAGAAAVAALALVVARRRRPVLRRLSWGAVGVTAMALLVTWAAPAAVAAATHGLVHHLARDLDGAGAPVRGVLVGTLGAATAVALLVALARPATDRPFTGRRAREAALLSSVGAGAAPGSTWTGPAPPARR